MRKAIAGLLMGLTFGIGTLAVAEIAVPRPAQAATETKLRPLYDRIIVRAQDEGQAAKPNPETSTGRPKTYANPQG